MGALVPGLVVHRQPGGLDDDRARAPLGGRAEAMSPELVAILAAIAAGQARVAAMQVANASIDLQAYPPRYSEQDFFAEAQALDGLSIRARNAS